MRIEQLQYLVMIADTKSFTVASERLYITQPSISQSITALEKELNVTLLRRTRVGAEPTPIGLEIIQEARGILEKIDHISALVAREQQQALTTLTIVAAPLITNSILPEAIVKLNEETMGHLNIVQNTTGIAEQMILSDQADLAVVPYVRLPENAALAFTPLFQVETMALVRKSSPLAGQKSLVFQEIQRHPVALFGSEYVSFKHIHSRISAYGPANIVLKTSSPELTKRVSLNSDYVGLAYDLSILNHPSVVSGDLVAIPIVEPVTMTFGILEKRQRKCSPLMKRLVEELTQKSNQTLQELAALHHRPA